MGLIKTIIGIVLILMLIGSFIIAPKETIQLAKDTAVYGIQLAKVMIKDGLNVGKVLLAKVGK